MTKTIKSLIFASMMACGIAFATPSHSFHQDSHHSLEVKKEGKHFKHRHHRKDMKCHMRHSHKCVKHIKKHHHRFHK